jgi:hypothetical protein
MPAGSSAIKLSQFGIEPEEPSMTALGTLRTWLDGRLESAFGANAEVGFQSGHVAF